MCEAVRELDRAQVSYKAYIDQLLAVVLETNSALLEGMPRLQQSSGLRLDLLRMASRGEVRVCVRVCVCVSVCVCVNRICCVLNIQYLGS